MSREKHIPQAAVEKRGGGRYNESRHPIFELAGMKECVIRELEKEKGKRTPMPLAYKPKTE
jgi:hypothetical protein